MRSPRVPVEEQYRLIMECRQSGLSDHQWCLNNDINPGTFYNWVKRLRQNSCRDIPERNQLADRKVVQQEVVKIEMNAAAPIDFVGTSTMELAMGWWYPNPYSSQDPDIMGDVLDMAFNTENKELVVILSNGQIMFCHEKYCRFHSAVDMITNFNVDAYDFRGCICSESITNQIRQNGGLIDKVFH